MNNSVITNLKFSKLKNKNNLALVDKKNWKFYEIKNKKQTNKQTKKSVQLHIVSTTTKLKLQRIV